MFARLFSRSLALVLAASALVACGDSTGPRYNPFDPDRAQADAEAMASAFASPTLDQFMSASGYINLSTGVLNAAVRSARQTVAAGSRVSAAQHRQIAQHLRDAIVGDPAIAAAAVIPQDVRGVTFVFDAGEHTYVPSQRTGAPANGVRYVLYELDANWELNPDSETGYIEVTDLAPAGANTFGVRLRVVGGSTTYLDYTLTGSAGQTSANLGVTGYVSNGTVRVDYTTGIAMNSSQSSANIQWQYGVSARGFSVSGSIIGFGGENMGTLELIVNSNRSQVRYLLQSGEPFSGSIYVNGSFYANITEGAEGLVITGANGQPLSAAELETLESLLFTGIESFFWSLMLLGPVGSIIPL